MNDYLKNIQAKLTSIPILSEAHPNSQSTVKVPSVKFQSSAIVSTISMTTSVTTPIWVSALVSIQLPDPLIQGTLQLKKKKLKKRMGLPLIPSYIMTISQDACTFTERIQAL